jgi:hypothetical protein
LRSEIVAGRNAAHRYAGSAFATVSPAHSHAVPRG